MYDWECRHVLGRAGQDVPFWTEVGRQAGGPILELACGAGRLTFPMADAGLRIVGIDNDLAMLSAAAVRRRARREQWPLFLAADMRHFALAARFPLIFVGYNSLQLLTEPGDMAACLTRAREHLAPAGLVGVEVTDFQFGGADGPAGDDPPIGAEPLGDAEGIRLSGTLVHDLASRTSRYCRRFVGDGWRLENEVVVRSLGGSELGHVLGQAGLTPVHWSGTGPTIRALAAPGE